jgi:hypothetical protein
VEGTDRCTVIGVSQLPTGAGTLTRLARVPMVPMVGPVAGWLEGHAQHSNLRNGEGRRVSIIIHDRETDTTGRAGCTHLSEMHAMFRA